MCMYACRSSQLGLLVSPKNLLHARLVKESPRFSWSGSSVPSCVRLEVFAAESRSNWLLWSISLLFRIPTKIWQWRDVIQDESSMFLLIATDCSDAFDSDFRANPLAQYHWSVCCCSICQDDRCKQEAQGPRKRCHDHQVLPVNKRLFYHDKLEPHYDQSHNYTV